MLPRSRWCLNFLLNKWEYRNAANCRSETYNVDIIWVEFSLGRVSEVTEHSILVRLRDFWVFFLYLLFVVGLPVARGVPKWSYISLLMKHFVPESRCGEAVSNDGSRVLSYEGLQQPNS